MDTTDKTENKGPFANLCRNIWDWLKHNFWIVVAVLVLAVVLSALQEQLTAVAMNTFTLVAKTAVGLCALWAVFAAIIIALITKVVNRCKIKSVADARSVFIALVLLGIGLYLFFAFPVWKMQTGAAITTAALYHAATLLAVVLWIVLPLCFYFRNYNKHTVQDLLARFYHKKSKLLLDAPVDKENSRSTIEVSYVNQLKELIDNYPLDYTGSIAITGSWGAGKTSYVNVLEGMLENDKENYIFVRFEPMKCERPELIQAAFFDQLEEALSPYRSGFSRYFRHYKDLIGAVDNKYAKFATTLFSLTQEEERQRIERAILILHRRIVVFIDDVDRLERNELVQIFRLVRFNAKFNNLVFLLAMDKTKVDAVMGSDGDFSDKFAEVEFYLPVQDPNKVWNFVTSNIELENQDQASMFKNDKTLAQFTQHCLPTMRDAKRFVNSFMLRFRLMSQSEEYVFHDYYLLSLLHYADPRAFDIVANSESFEQHQELYYIQRQKFIGTKVETDTILWQLICELFPSVPIESDNHSQYSINTRNFYSNYFDEMAASLGFSFYKANSLLSMRTSEEISHRIKEWSQKDEFKKRLTKYYQNYPTDKMPKDNIILGKYFIIRHLLKIEPLVFSKDEGLARVTKDGKWGYIDEEGQIKIQLKYDTANDFSQGLAFCKENNTFGFINTKGNFEIMIDFNQLNFHEGLAAVKKDGEWGFIDEEGHLVIPFEYDDAGWFSEGLTAVKKDGKWGFIDKEGHVVIPFEYDFAKNFSEGLARVKKDGKWGFIDKEGNLYDAVGQLSEGLAAWGFIDKEGHVVIPFEYDLAWEFSEGLARVEKDGKWGFIDKEGHVVIPFEYDVAESFYKGLARVKKDGKVGFIDKEGHVVIPFEYDNTGSFSEGLAYVMKDGKYGYIDKEGHVVIPLEYDFALAFSEGLTPVKKDGKWGFIDKEGHVVIPFEYDYAEDFSEGLAQVRKDGKYGFIDKEGHVVIPFEYDDARAFSEGLAAVKKDGKWGFIDKEGHVIIPFEYDEAWWFSEGLAAVKKNRKWGFIDKEGHVVIPFEYDAARKFSGGLARVKKDGEWFYINQKGERLDMTK